MKGELIDNRIVVWNIKDSKKLFSSGYYGKPIGISKPKLDEINVPLILDLIEGYYLLQNSKMKITFKSEDRYFEAEVETTGDIYEAIKDGMVAMSFHKETAKELVETLQEENDN